jgi:hypothetical protein
MVAVSLICELVERGQAGLAADQVPSYGTSCRAVTDLSFQEKMQQFSGTDKPPFQAAPFLLQTRQC